MRFRRKFERGATLVEGALALPVLFLIVFGMIEFSRAMFAWNFVTYAAHEATRYAGLRAGVSEADVREYVRGQAVGLDPSALDVTADWSAARDRVRVVVRYEAGVVRLHGVSSGPGPPQ